jgi:phospholipid-transporting ATPase
MVVFTGHETKLMRNATAAPIKRTAVENKVNLQTIFLFTILIVLCVISSAGELIKDFAFGSTLDYLFLGGINAVSSFFLNFLTFWILYSNLVPLSYLPSPTTKLTLRLFVTIELVKYAQAYLINVDLDMYYPETDTPAVCRTSSLVEELGQIEYVFSDKTGTLTCNMMQFRQASIGGIQYGDDVPEDQKARVIDGVEEGVFDFNRLRENIKGPNGMIIKEFLTLLATCHTVIPERNDEKPTEITYQAASPDEGALVEGASMLGYKFTTRRPKSVGVLINDDSEKEYEVLNICEFNSSRKRMSTILRCPDGKIRLYCKGADTVILERLAKNNPYVDLTTQHLEDYATDGLRTLCLALREIPEDEYRQWSAIYDKAATTINNRSEELDKAAELIEKDLFLLGATAIEDRLQDGVPEAIHTLQTAGIKVWYNSHRDVVSDW